MFKEERKGEKDKIFFVENILGVCGELVTACITDSPEVGNPIGTQNVQIKYGRSENRKFPIPASWVLA